MRLWSLHPSLLDSKGLVALWREGLLAKNVLEGKTIGYRNHPQLDRFKAVGNPIEYINEYLYQVLLESQHRKFKFDPSKVRQVSGLRKLNIKKGQIEYELNHLIIKLRERDHKHLKQILKKQTECHPLFEIIEGGVEDWEKLK